MCFYISVLLLVQFSSLCFPQYIDRMFSCLQRVRTQAMFGRLSAPLWSAIQGCHPLISLLLHVSFYFRFCYSFNFFFVFSSIYRLHVFLPSARTHTSHVWKALRPTSCRNPRLPPPPTLSISLSVLLHFYVLLFDVHIYLSLSLSI